MPYISISKIYGKLNGTKFVKSATANTQSFQKDTTRVNAGTQSSLAGIKN